MVVPPGFSENLALVSQLTGQIITKILKSVLELILESVKNAVHVMHGLNSLLLVLLDLTIDIIENNKVRSSVLITCY